MKNYLKRLKRHTKAWFASQAAVGRGDDRIHAFLDFHHRTLVALQRCSTPEAFARIKANPRHLKVVADVFVSGGSTITALVRLVDHFDTGNDHVVAMQKFDDVANRNFYFLGGN